MSPSHEIILLLSVHILFTDAGIMKKQVLTVHSGEGIQNHFDKYYGSRTGFRKWPILQSLSYEDRNVLCLITFKATNMTTDLKFCTTKLPNSILPYYIQALDRTLEINVNRCLVFRCEYKEEGEQVEIPWYEFYLAETELDHCVYRFSFPRVGGKEEIFLQETGVHALKLICEIDFAEDAPPYYKR